MAQEQGKENTKQARFALEQTRAYVNMEQDLEIVEHQQPSNLQSIPWRTLKLISEFSFSRVSGIFF